MKAAVRLFGVSWSALDAGETVDVVKQVLVVFLILDRTDGDC